MFGFLFLLTRMTLLFLTGNALLIGVRGEKNVLLVSYDMRSEFFHFHFCVFKGTGKQSLTKLAAHISGMKLMSITITNSYGRSDWNADLKHILTCAGTDNQEIVFLFSDSQIKHESFLEVKLIFVHFLCFSKTKNL